MDPQAHVVNPGDTTINRIGLMSRQVEVLKLFGLSCQQH